MDTSSTSRKSPVSSFFFSRLSCRGQGVYGQQQRTQIHQGQSPYLAQAQPPYGYAGLPLDTLYAHVLQYFVAALGEVLAAVEHEILPYAHQSRRNHRQAQDYLVFQVLALVLNKVVYQQSQQGGAEGKGKIGLEGSGYQESRT